MSGSDLSLVSRVAVMSVSSIMADSHASQLHLLVLHQLYKPHISGKDSIRFYSICLMNILLMANSMSYIYP